MSNDSKKKLRIQVKDYGIGIKAKFLPNIFERFSQADSTPVRQYKGLGLGLSIVRNLVEMHQGTVQVESSGEGKGTTFTVCLPIKVEDKMRDQGSGAELTPQILEGLSVLIVEDLEPIREALGVTVGVYGANIRSAQSAREALSILRHFIPNVIISDIAMPSEDGYSFIRKVRAMGPKVSDIPAIALTAYAGEEDVKKMLAAGFQSHIPKPVDATRLVLAINYLGRGGANTGYFHSKRGL